MSLISARRNESALKNAWLSELQAVTIYQTEHLILSLTPFGQLRRKSIAVYKEVLAEELAHSAGLKPYLSPSLVLTLSATASRASGVFIGLLLSTLPSRMSWRVHAWAEHQASDIYRLTAAKLSGPIAPALRESLIHAQKQERGHALRFETLFKDHESLL